MKKLLIPALLCISVAACAAQSGGSGDSAQAEQAIRAAEAAQTKVDKVGFAWRDTDKLIASAKEAAKQGKAEEAVKLAKQAQEESEDAWAQYQANKNAGPRF